MSPLKFARPRAPRATLLSAILAAAFLGTAAHAENILLSKGWIRALPGNGPAGGYFALTNHSGKRIVLVGASSPACGMLMLHETEEMSGMSEMENVANIPLAPGATLNFAPGGYHLMCMDPKPAIRPGNRVPVTLLFKGGLQVRADFEIRSATGR